ncbi:hypothetical protein MA16_Dca016334 [Dendrobium catenatum]|uniref:Transposase-associated domain-containing protein n=1 Tax=Dendrobium catenatum TaxID=906689 RepID=A0A2I0W8A9_9ASPA|nr:hypothetical protein MA16_Dca016334 [Dendrobium catenatum]
MILCPCRDCGNGICRTRDDVEAHLLWRGFKPGYYNWTAHGETSFRNDIGSHSLNVDDVNDDMEGLLNDAFGFESNTADEQEEINKPNANAKKFYKLISDSQQELFSGCKKFSKLDFLVRLLQLKCLGNWTQKSFTMLLDLLREAIEDIRLPKSYYETKKIIQDLGLSYKKYDACRNDCILYWGPHEFKNECDICNESRWSSKKKKKVAGKVMWHFPLTSRLQRLFMSSKTASYMIWHKEDRIKDGCMRHPADTPAWQHLDYQDSNFAADPRNVQLGLASDGFNPFGTMTSTHSTWSVVLMTYNLPPNLCMKSKYMRLSLLIPGPTQPGNDIDVYLQPLVAELKELWEIGV